MFRYEVLVTESWSGAVEVYAENEKEAKELALDLVQTEYDKTVDVYIVATYCCKSPKRRISRRTPRPSSS